MTLAFKSSKSSLEKPKRSLRYRCFEFGVSFWENFRPDYTTNINQDFLIETAQQITGLDNFGDQSFRAPMTILIDSLKKEANLNATGRFLFRDTVLYLLINRLQ